MGGSVVSELVLKFTGDTKDALAAIGVLDSKVAGTAKNYISALGNMDNSLAKFVSNHPVAAASAAVFAAAVVYAGAKAVEAAGQYDESTTALANTAQISKSAADTIGTSFLQTAGKSTFSAQQIMDAYAPVSGRLGEVEGHALTNAEAMKVMTGAQDLAEATGANLTTTTDNLSRVMKDYHLSADQAGGASNDLYNLQRLTGNSTDSLVTAFDRLQPTIVGTNVTFDQSSGLMLEMTDAFGSGRKAIGLIGTAMQSMTEPTTSAKKALEAVGISFVDSTGKFKGLGPVLDELKGYMDSNASATDKAALMQTVFGKNAVDMTKIVEGGSAALDASTKKISDNDAVSKAAGANANTLAGQQKTLAASFKDVEISIGQALLPIMNSLMGVIKDIVGPIANWVTKHQELASSIAKVIGIMVALMGTVVVLAAAIDFLLSPWTLLVAAIALVIVFHQKIMDFFKRWWPELLVVFTGGIGLLILAIIKWHTQIWDAIQTVWHAITKFLSDIWNGLVDLWNNTGGKLITAIAGAWDTVTKAISQEWQKISSDLASIWSNIVIIWDNTGGKLVSLIGDMWPVISAAISAAWSTITGILSAFWQTISGIASAVWNGIATIISTVWSFIEIVISTATEIIKNVLSATWDVISGAVQVAWDIIKGIINTALDIIKGIFQAFADIVTGKWGQLWTDIRNTAAAIFSDIANVITSIATTIWNTLVAIWNSIYASLSAILKSISDLINTVWNAIYNAISGVLNTISSTISGTWETIKSAASAAWNFFKDNIVMPVWDALKNTVGGVFTSIQNTIQGVWDNIKSAAKTMWDAIVGVISTAWDGVKKVVQAPINVAIDLIDGFVDGASTVLHAVGVHILDKVHIDHVNFASGGTVPGGWGGGDTVPAMLTPGERVLSLGQVKQMGGHQGIDNMLGLAHGGVVPGAGVQYFADGGIVGDNPGGGQVISGGMVGDVFRGAWRSPKGTVYQDQTPPGSSGPQVKGTFVDVATLTGYVKGSGTPLDQEKPVTSDIGKAIVGLGEVFIKGALIAAAHVALDPLKLLLDHLPDGNLSETLAKHAALAIPDGIFQWISNYDNQHGIDPISTTISGVPITPDLEAAALKYAIDTFSGHPYTWGNEDCSGIVQKAYAHVGIGLPRVSSTQYTASTPVTEAQAIPGDLAFYNPGESGAPAGLPGHVGFYAGPGKIFDAYNTSKPIGFDPLSLPGNTFMGIRRPGFGVGGGALPAGVGGPNTAMTAQQWAASLLSLLGAPANAGMVDFIWRWEAAEGGVWSNSNAHNPLNIAAFDNNPNNPGSNFATWGAGLAATVQALHQANFIGLYNGIMSGDAGKALAALIASPWATSHYNGGSSFPGSPGAYGNTPHMSQGGIVGYSVGGDATGLIRVGENGPETIDLGNRHGYVYRNGTGPGIDYDRLAEAIARHQQQGVQIGNINVTQSDASPSEIVDEFNWHMRVARLGVQQ